MRTRARTRIAAAAVVAVGLSGAVSAAPAGAATAWDQRGAQGSAPANDDPFDALSILGDSSREDGTDEPGGSNDDPLAVPGTGAQAQGDQGGASGSSGSTDDPFDALGVLGDSSHEDGTDEPAPH